MTLGKTTHTVIIIIRKQDNSENSHTSISWIINLSATMINLNAVMTNFKGPTWLGHGLSSYLVNIGERVSG